jgi:hypothetical protein
MQISILIFPLKNTMNGEHMYINTMHYPSRLINFVS